MQKPSIGRIVHFYDRSYEANQPNGIGPYPAIITYVWGGSPDFLVNLEVFGLGQAHETSIPYNDAPEAATSSTWWCWPTKVE